MNPVKTLPTYGQAIWLDYIRRGLLDGGGFERMIRDDGVSGVTSNPSIFEKAITGSRDYTGAIADLAHRHTLSDEALYEQIAMTDIRRAADLLRPEYDQSQGRNGYVSLEVSPRLAMDTEGTTVAARRLWKEVDRPNLMIKVPATTAGLPAVEELIAEGLNVNVTLLFSLSTYEQVAERYLRGLERRLEAGHEVHTVASVASFFLSRIDTAVDARIDNRLNANPGAADRSLLEATRGKVAIASARLAYQHWKSVFRGPRWRALETAGARPQRLLWASTGTKNPTYSDVRYVESLIGPETINTLPPATLGAFRDHGRPHLSLTEHLDTAAVTLANLKRLDIDLDKITDELLTQGLEQFDTAYDRLLRAVTEARGQALAAPIDRQSLDLPPALDARVRQLLADWQSNNRVERLWSRDAALWTGRGEDRWLEWLDIVPAQIGRLSELRRVSHLAEGLYFQHLVLLGMGGSSLAPEVLGRVLGHAQGHPELIVLDSTDPDQIRGVERQIDLERTLFVVASKSGSTLEANLLAEYFLERLSERIGDERAGRHFIAITDRGSSLDRHAAANGYREVYHGRSGIGGRYSALSDFGLVPAALLGLDLERFLERAAIMVEACAAVTPAADNPAVMLGLALGAARHAGWDKITLVATPGIAPIGAWLEQLLAESTGKYGTGLIPLSDEPLGPPEVYGDDRVFVYLRLDAEADAEQDAALERLGEAGHPIVRIQVADRYDLGQEFFRWELATAVAGAVLNINPFDQPDVEAAKLAARRLAADYEKSGELPSESPLIEDGGLSLYADPAYAAELRTAAGPGETLDKLFAEHLRRLEPSDYFALLAYLDRADPRIAERLQALRLTIRDRSRNATCLGYGPRYLHATGQVYKGGPDTGVFLILTRKAPEALELPGRRLSFGIVQTAQALADQRELAARGRRTLRLHLGTDPLRGLDRLTQTAVSALG